MRLFCIHKIIFASPGNCAIEKYLIIFCILVLMYYHKISDILFGISCGFILRNSIDNKTAFA